jgi:peptide/nickel transport system substrate-binding protein
MTNFGSPMFSPKSFDADGTFIATAAGTGPFKVVEHVLDQYVVLERFDGYYGEQAHTERVRIKVIPDGNTRFSALRSEEILGVLDLGAMQPNLAKELEKEDRFEISVEKSSIIHYLAPNGTTFPFNDVRMRQAVSLMIDRQLILDEFYAGYPAPATHILNYASPFYSELPVSYDPEKARELAKEVLGDTRQSIELIIPSPFVKRYPYKEQGEYIQAVLSELGLDVTIKIMEFGAISDAMKKGNYDLCMRIQGLPNGEPYSILNSFMRSNSVQNKSYSLGFSNSEADDLLGTLAQTVKMDERTKLYTQLQQLSAQELPFIPLFNDVALLVYNTKITDYHALIYGVTLPTMRWAE